MIFPGIVVINKPFGWTSHDVVNFVRKKFDVKRVGHTGTLDPVATGVLVVMIGKKATKFSKKLSAQDKEYIFEIEFGKKTDTGDTEGEMVEEISYQDIKLSRKEVEGVVHKFLGEIEQTVPLFSAVKIKGKKLYELARSAKGGLKNHPKLPKRKITIHELKLLEFTPGTKNSYPTAKFHVTCSKGTYTRALAEDIGKSLGFPSYQKSLVRTRCGDFTLDKAVELDNLSENDIIPLASSSSPV